MMGITAEAFEWLKTGIRFRKSDAVECLYDRMESQSGHGLPVIYQPFDGGKLAHFADRGQILDYVLTLGPGRILDFGPGDGWPSLLIAPMVQEVIGLDASRRRVETCAANAVKLGIKNASFVWVASGAPFPFDDGSFDGVAAAASVEQTPDVRATLREIYRVLKPGGRLRMHYESLGCYRGSGEREVYIDTDAITVYDRHIREEYVVHYQVVIDGKKGNAMRLIEDLKRLGEDALVELELIKAVCGHAIDAATWVTNHPSCQTLLMWLEEAGFRSADPTYDGGWFANMLFDRLTAADRPIRVDAVDAMLRPAVGVIVKMKTRPESFQGEWDPWITATR